MDFVKQMADGFMILIRVGAVLRVIYCFINMGISEDESTIFKKRAKNAVVFYVFAECIWQIKDLVLSYYK